MAKRPPKIVQVRSAPVSLNESTLETNIAAEIITLFNRPINFGYHHRLRWLFGFDRINIRAFRKRQAKLYRLTPIEENRGGGWDTKITIPTSNNQSRAVFIQFKSGTHSDGNSIAKSLFNLSIKNPNPNVHFTFNDNTSKKPVFSNNQHESLKALADELKSNSISPDTVMYAFPRITKLIDFENLDEDLLLHTTFLTIPEIDKEAKNAGINLYDRNVHYFRTCYFQESRREIASEVFQLKENNTYENILYEIILVKLSHIRNQYSTDFPQNYLNNELFIMLADYLRIDPSEIVEIEKYYPSPISDEIKNYFKNTVSQRDSKFSSIYGQNNTESLPFQWRERLFNRVIKFFNVSENQKIDIVKDIPNNYTFNLPEKEIIEFNIKTELNPTLIVF